MDETLPSLNTLKFDQCLMTQGLLLWAIRWDGDTAIMKNSCRFCMEAVLVFLGAPFRGCSRFLWPCVYDEVLRRTGDLPTFHEVQKRTLALFCRYPDIYSIQFLFITACSLH